MEKQQIIDTANALIAARKELLHTLIGTLALSMLPLVVVLGMLIHGVRLDMNLVLTFLAIPLVVGAVAWVVWWYGESNYHRASDAVLEMTKEYIVRTMTDGLLEDVRIDQPVEKQVLKTVCRQMSLPSHDKARVGTSIRGFYHGKAFQMFDLELIETVTVKERVTDPKTGKKVIEEHTEDNTVFEGQVYQLQQFPRMPETSLLIQKRTGFGSPTAMARLKGNVRETESLEFNRAYSITCRDAFSVFLVLTPAMIDRMNGLRGSIKDNLNLLIEPDGAACAAIQTGCELGPVSTRIPENVEQFDRLQDAFEERFGRLFRMFEELELDAA